jgi:hypothetical protein
MGKVNLRKAKPGERCFEGRGVLIPLGPRPRPKATPTPDVKAEDVGDVHKPPSAQPGKPR